MRRAEVTRAISSLGDTATLKGGPTTLPGSFDLGHNPGRSSPQIDDGNGVRLRRLLNLDLAVDQPHLAIIDGYSQLRAAQSDAHMHTDKATARIAADVPLMPISKTAEL